MKIFKQESTFYTFIFSDKFSVPCSPCGSQILNNQQAWYRTNSFLNRCNIKNMAPHVSDKRLEKHFVTSLEYKSKQTTEREFFILFCLYLNVPMYHVLFKLPSAGTPISKCPWSLIPLCLPDSHLSITCLSLPSSMEDREGTVERLFLRGNIFFEEHTSRKKKKNFSWRQTEMTELKADNVFTSKWMRTCDGKTEKGQDE